MEQGPLTFLTYGDVADSGACLDGVIEACKRRGTWSGDVATMLEKFSTTNERQYIKEAAKLDGSGYGYGYGSGDGSGSYGESDSDGGGEI